jgi:hypothetical protein
MSLVAMLLGSRGGRVLVLGCVVGWLGWMAWGDAVAGYHQRRAELTHHSGNQHGQARTPAAPPQAAPAAPPSPAGRGDIPGGYLALYQAAAQTCPGLPWGVLAGIGKVESDHGRSDAPGVRSGVNSLGCCAGPMQFNIGNGPPSTWDRYGDGTLAHVYQPRYAIPAAAWLLCANGARGGRDVRGAVYAYNHDWGYVDRVLALAGSYQAGGP